MEEQIITILGMEVMSILGGPNSFVTTQALPPGRIGWSTLAYILVCQVFLKYVLEPLEHTRRWGLVCGCCADKRRAGQKVSCVRTGRRLAEAALFIDKIKRELEDNLRALTLEECEHIQWIYDAVSLALRKLLPLF